MGKMFSKKNYLVKNRIMPKNPKRDPLGSLNVFYKRKTSNNSRGTLDKIQKFSEKSRIVPKKTKGDPLVSPLLLEALQNFWFSARLEPTLSCFSKSEN